MRCDQIELLLPAYVAEDLSADEKARVDTHVRGCPTCEASLADYRELEGLLLQRSEARPAAALTAQRVVRRLGLGRERGILDALAFVPRVVTALTGLFGGLPGIIGGSLIGVGILMLIVGDAARDFLTRLGNEFVQRLPAAIDQLPLAIERFTRTLDTTTGGHEWVPLVVYLGVFLVIASTGSWMVMRFVRE